MKRKSTIILWKYISKQSLATSLPFFDIHLYNDFRVGCMSFGINPDILTLHCAYTYCFRTRWNPESVSNRNLRQRKSATFRAPMIASLPNGATGLAAPKRAEQDGLPVQENDGGK